MENEPTTYEGFYIAENILDFPGQMAIVKLSYPRLFIRFDYADSYFASYEDFISSIAVAEWLDGETPGDEEKDHIFTDCWNFLALTEREEERQAEERDAEDALEDPDNYNDEDEEDE